MEASDGVIRGNVDSLMKLVGALDAAGIELIADNAVSGRGGRGVRLQEAAAMTLLRSPCHASRCCSRCSAIAVVIGRATAATPLVYGVCLAASLMSLVAALEHLLGARCRLSNRRCRSACRGSARISASMRSSAFFLVVVNLGAVTAPACTRSAMAGTRSAPQRVLPFYPAFLAGMNLVVLADDAFTLPVRLGVHVADVVGAGDGAPPRARQRARRLRLSS